MGNGRCGDRPRLTVENYVKWYELYVCFPDGRVEAVSFGDLEDFRGDESAYVDHVPNPKAVFALARARGWDVDCTVRAATHRGVM